MAKTEAAFTERVMLGDGSNMMTVNVSLLLILMTIITFVLVTLVAHRYCAWPETDHEYIAIEDKTVPRTSHIAARELNEGVCDVV